MRTKAQQKAAEKGRSVIRDNRNKRKVAIYKSYKPPTHDPLFMLGLGLYCGEGSKTQCVQFSSASPSLIRFMLYWFTTYFVVEDYYLWVQHYGQKTPAVMKRHWSQLSNVPSHRIRLYLTPPSKQSQKKRGHTLLYGTAHLRILKSYTVLRLQIRKAQETAKLNPADR